MDGSNFKDTLEQDIAYAKAESVSFTVLPVNNTQGQVTSDVTSAKIGYPVEISFEANTTYGFFLEWQAYSNYSYDEDSQTILGDRLSEEDISFEESSKSTTKMTVHKPVKNVRIVPAVTPNPYIWFNAPSYTENDLVYSVGKTTPFGRSAINTQNTLSLTAESYSGFAIKNWLVQTPDGQVLKDIQAFYNNGENNIDVTKSFFCFSDDFTPSQNPLFTFNSAAISDDQSSSSVLVTANTAAVEGYIFTPVCVTRPKVLSVTPDISQKISRMHTIVFTFNRELKESSVDVRVRSFSPSDSDFKIDNSIYYPPQVSGKTITLKTKKTVEADTQIEITLLPLIADSQGITLGESKVYTFTTGDVKDIEPPEISSAKLYFYSAETSDLTIVFDSYSTRNEPVTASHTIKTDAGTNFEFLISASDENTGNSGIQSYKITERVVELTENMLISVNDEILDYTQETDDKNLYTVPIGGKSLYDSNGNWNGKWLSESQQLRFYTESSYGSGSINYDAIAIGGIHQISVQAVDEAGNISEQKDFFVQFAGEDIGSENFYILRKAVLEGADYVRLALNRAAYNEWKTSRVKCK